MQRIGNELRQKNGYGYLAEQILKKSKNKKNVNIVIDGIKNPYEIRILNQLKNFFTIAINASFEKRWNRVKDIYSGDQKRFEEDDKRDHSESMDFGQQVDKCVYYADILIQNEDTVRSYYDKLDEYRALLHNVISGEKVRLPNPREQNMTQAYCESLRSSCLKRKVGAVITTKDDDTISSAFNEVPKGEQTCFEKYRMCYRDSIKMEFIKKLKKCPNCGQELIKNYKCPKCNNDINEFCYNCPNCRCEFEPTLRCQNSRCDIDILKSYVPKELDKCRSLHAEEMAIINLSKLGGVALKNTVLYTTTYPCQLCANKIIETGINEIVFAEPYPSKESKELLERYQGKNEIKLSKFEGVKGRGYFKIFDRI